MSVLYQKLNIHESRQKTRKLGDELGPQMSDEQSNTLSMNKSALLRTVTEHQDDRATYMGDIASPDHPDRRKARNAEPEQAELGLPSSYLVGSLKDAGLLSMVEVERNLRRSVCDDALHTLRELLGIKAVTLKFKNANIRGQIGTTRAEAKLKEHNKKIAAVQWRYNNSRAALVRLELPSPELDMYQKVSSDDLTYLKTYLEEESGKLGEGKREIPWLWRTSANRDSEQWQVDGMCNFSTKITTYKIT